jgi:hypothetical protein
MAEISAEPVSSGFSGGPAPHVNEALTDMHTYTLLLEGDWERLGRRLEGLVTDGASSEEFSQLVGRRAEIQEELEALRTTTAALRRQTVDDLPSTNVRAGRVEPAARAGRVSRPGLAGPRVRPPGFGSAPAA